jgi:hypothetical protein
MGQAEIGIENLALFSHSFPSSVISLDDQFLSFRVRVSLLLVFEILIGQRTTKHDVAVAA